MKAVLRDEKEMKDSGIAWASKMPNHWVTIPLYSVLEEINQKNEPIITTNILSLTNTDGVIPYSERGNQGNKAKTSFEDYKVVYPNTIVANSMNILIGSVGLSKYEGCVSPVYYVYKSKNDTDIRYINYLFQMESFQKNLRQYANGILEIRLRVSSHDILHQNIAFPSYKEQELIANYLDDRCSKIDTIITKAKASIEEYKELKQAVITQAVTLGIKKNRPLKDTNILWIGKTPCDWQVAELKFFASIKSGITLGQKYPAGAKLMEVPYLRVANVQGEYVDLSDVKTIQVLPEEVDKYRLDAGVVLMTEGGDRDKLGRGCVWHGEITPCLHQNHIFALTTKSDKLLPEYFSHVTTSEVARCYFDYTAKKTTNLANTNSSTIMNFRLPIPPLEEQREIVQYLDKRIKTLNDMISEKQSLIEDLESYKKSLIYEVVTGKRKVVA